VRTIHLSALAIALVAAVGISSSVSGQGKPAAPVFAPNAGDYKTADIRIITPGVVFSSGLDVVSAEFTKQSGKSVGITTVGMGTIVEEIGKRTPAPDIIFLPFQLMNTLALDGGVMPGTMVPFGRHPMGLAVRAGAPKPDISTVEKFAAAIKGAKAVMRSNPASRTMVATLIDDVLKRPEFADFTPLILPNRARSSIFFLSDGWAGLHSMSHALAIRDCAPGIFLFQLVLASGTNGSGV
jgi:molybdate transport system substrate-binding protein